MYYCQIALRGIRGIFTWEIPKNISVGVRVKVIFRKRKRVGVVVLITRQKPTFETQPILEVWDQDFLSKPYLELAQSIAQQNFTSIEKVLSLMIPEMFWQKQDPVKYDVFYKLNLNSPLKKEDEKKFKRLGPKQKLVLAHFETSKIVSEKDLRELVSLPTIKSLCQKGLIEKERGRIETLFRVDALDRTKNHTLNDDQERVLSELRASDKPDLLFGVTGSGKTEIYKHLAQQLLNQKRGGQTLLLVPEIALTSQLIAEFRNVFGNDMAVWHSHLSAGEKVQEWARVTSGEAKILIGARSAILVPMKNPKLIILDEEHEWTYKNEFAPRFWTHDIAELIAQKFKSKLVFGSATPRLESFEKVKDGDWHCSVLDKRVSETKMPNIQIVDLRNEAKRGNYSPLSEPMVEALQKTLSREKQAVIFLNKRGFSGSTMCKDCGYNFHCKNCELPMKLHRKFTHDYGVNKEKLICHFCGYMTFLPKACPSCETKNFEFKGWGTQMVEDVLIEKFPQARVLRADRDTVTGKHDFENLMKVFHEKKADILIGTQMIAKGLDFEDVEFCGVILADIGLHLPDFRAEERVFQLLTQVSGRAGRRERQGEILIQTYNPDEKIFQFVRHHDVQGFIDWQTETRKKLDMPPFSRIIKFTFSDRDKAQAFVQAKSFEKKMQSLLDRFTTLEVHYAPAFFPRMNNKYHFHVFLKVSKEHFETLLEVIDLPKHVKIDTSPMSLL